MEVLLLKGAWLGCVGLGSGVQRKARRGGLGLQVLACTALRRWPKECRGAGDDGLWSKSAAMPWGVGMLLGRPGGDGRVSNGCRKIRATGRHEELGISPGTRGVAARRERGGTCLAWGEIYHCHEEDGKGVRALLSASTDLAD